VLCSRAPETGLRRHASQQEELFQPYVQAVMCWAPPPRTQAEFVNAIFNATGRDPKLRSLNHTQCLEGLWNRLVRRRRDWPT
jgi:hypothetical protein